MVELAPDFEGVSGLHKRSHKPEQAWRHFRALRPDEMPVALRAVVERAVSLGEGVSRSGGTS